MLAFLFPMNRLNWLHHSLWFLSSLFIPSHCSFSSKSQGCSPLHEACDCIRMLLHGLRNTLIKMLSVNIICWQVIAFWFYLHLTQHPNFLRKSETYQRNRKILFFRPEVVKLVNLIKFTLKVLKLASKMFKYVCVCFICKFFQVSKFPEFPGIITRMSPPERRLC